MKAKLVIISIAATALLGSVALLEARAVSADDISPPMNIIERLAEKFNLDQEEVESVFDEDRQEREEHRLGQLLSEGEITQEQVDLIHEKTAELHDEMEEIRDTYDDPEERHDAMEELHEEMNTWTEENDLPVVGPLVEGRHGGPRMSILEGEGPHMGECPYEESE